MQIYPTQVGHSTQHVKTSVMKKVLGGDVNTTRWLLQTPSWRRGTAKI